MDTVWIQIIYLHKIVAIYQFSKTIRILFCFLIMLTITNLTKNVKINKYLFILINKMVIFYIFKMIILGFFFNIVHLFF